MNGRKKILIALFSALVLLVAVTMAGCFGDENGEEGLWEEVICRNNKEKYKNKDIP